MAKKKIEPFDSRKYMQLAVEAMIKSIDEPRTDGKISPKVGAVLIKPDGSVEIGYRGELRYGDHAEFTVLERKNRHADLTGSKLFATLEPCAPGSRRHPKLGCAERIVNARIKEVWVGIADPDADVDRKGIQYLKRHGIIVRMFDREFQAKINEANKAFIEQARQRADGIEPEQKEFPLTSLENGVLTEDKEWYSSEAIQSYLTKSKRNLTPLSDAFWNHFENIGMVKRNVKAGIENIVPTGYGILLFGKEPREYFPQAAVKLKATYNDGKSSAQEADLPLVLMPPFIESWLQNVIRNTTVRNSSQRATATDFPYAPLREAIINAIVHRNYEITEARAFVEIDDEKIVVRSAGEPVYPISIDEIKNLEAASLSRNPKIAYVFNRMGYMEEAELGMDTFRNMQQQFKLPSPNVDYKEPYLVFTFPRTTLAASRILSKQVLEKLNEEEVLGYDFLKARKSITKKQYAVHFGFNEKKAQRHLLTFKRLKLVRQEGKGRSVKYQVVE